MELDKLDTSGGATEVAQPVLAFAIPTWNRGEKLRECVERIAKQILEAKEPVGIFLSDNGSDDSTPDVIRELAGKYNFLQHTRQIENVGFDRNLFTAMREARGTYIWIFSDDDFLADGALDAILQVIHEAKPSYIAANYYCCDDHASLCESQPYRPYMVNADVPGADIDTIFRTSGWVLGFISRNIFLKELLQVETYEALLDHIRVWPQIYAVAQVVAGRNDAYLSSFYSVGCRVVEARYGNDAVLKDLPEVLDYSLRASRVSEDTRRFCIDQIRNYFITWKSYIKYRALGPQPSPLIYPPGHRFIPLVPEFLVRAALSIKKRLR